MTIQPASAERVEERPTAAFVLSLIAGLIVVFGGGTVMMTTFPSNGPYSYGGMMGGYYGGMMGGYNGMMRGLGFGGGWFFLLGAIGVVSGTLILIGSIMLYSRPTQAAIWGAIVLAFSIISLFGMGGFFLGAILGVLGGILALVWK